MPETPLKTEAEIHAAVFPDDRWIYDPVSKSAIARDLLRSCSCGSARFVYVARPGVGGQIDAHVYCQHCRENREFRWCRMKREGDVVYADLDAASGRVTYTRQEAEIRRLMPAAKPEQNTNG
jgi:hypothetical protein